MPDLTPQLLPLLKTTRLSGFPDDPDWIYPRYADQSILGIPSAVCRFLGAPGLGAEALPASLLAPLGGGFRRVVLVLVDALALHRLRRWMTDGTAPRWIKLAEEGLLIPLTSVIPSTTTTALTTLWTGRSPAEHAVAGYELWLKEYGMVTNMIAHAPITFQNELGILAKAGFNPETFLAPTITLGTHLAAHGVKPFAFQQRTIARSGLSQMLFKDVDVQSFGTPADLWVNLRLLLESRPQERLYAWAYWGEVDHFSHFYGPDDERPAAEFSSFTHAFERQFLDRLSAAARRDTLVILTADHGALATPRFTHNELANHPDLVRGLHMLPSGEGRLPYLFPRPAHAERLREYIETAWPGKFWLIDAEKAVDAGLFGPGQPHKRLFDRLGDWIAIPRSNQYWWWADKENKLVGRHGGLHTEEMLVPFLAFRM
jgi:hypothetical protein